MLEKIVKELQDQFSPNVGKPFPPTKEHPRGGYTDGPRFQIEKALNAEASFPESNNDRAPMIHGIPFNNIEERERLFQLALKKPGPF